VGAMPRNAVYLLWDGVFYWLETLQLS
jgi:hypothetical protein